jgi:hypothetical protein
MGRRLKPAAAACLLLVLTLSSCAGPSTEEMGRNAIREKAAEGKAWFTEFTSATDTANRVLVTSKLEGLGNPYDFGWDAEGDFYTDHYYREHLTTSGGWWGEQRTVGACVQFAVASGQVTSASVDCPDKRPYSDYVDERVTVP